MECPICRYSFVDQIKKMKKKTKEELEKDSMKLKQGESDARMRMQERESIIAKEK